RGLSRFHRFGRARGRVGQTALRRFPHPPGGNRAPRTDPRRAAGLSFFGTDTAFPRIRIIHATRRNRFGGSCIMVCERAPVPGYVKLPPSTVGIGGPLVSLPTAKE